VRGEDSTLLSAVAALIWPRECSRGKKSQPSSTRDGHTEQTTGLGLYPPCLQAAWVVWGSEWGGQGTAPWSHICRYSQIFEIPRPQCSPRNASKWPCHATHSAGPATLAETLSFGFHLAHSLLQLLHCLLFHPGYLLAYQRDLAVRDLDLGSQDKPAPASHHSRLVLRLDDNLAQSGATQAYRLLGQGDKSPRLPLLAEIQWDSPHLPSTAKRSRVRAQGK
jgi:hypothetical protein